MNRKCIICNVPIRELYTKTGMFVHTCSQKCEDEFLKNDGVYIRINAEHLKKGCFCSLGECTNEFFVDQIVVSTGGNLFHVKCAGDMRIRKPNFTDIRNSEDYPLM